VGKGSGPVEFLETERRERKLTSRLLYEGPDGGLEHDELITLLV
jgi:hypothetical protein